MAKPPVNKINDLRSKVHCSDFIYDHTDLFYFERQILSILNLKLGDNTHRFLSQSGLIYDFCLKGYWAGFFKVPRLPDVNSFISHLNGCPTGSASKLWDLRNKFLLPDQSHWRLPNILELSSLCSLKRHYGSSLPSCFQKFSSQNYSEFSVLSSTLNHSQDNHFTFRAFLPEYVSQHNQQLNMQSLFSNSSKYLSFSNTYLLLFKDLPYVDKDNT